MDRKLREESKLPLLREEFYSQENLSNILIQFHNCVPQSVRINPKTYDSYWITSELHMDLIRKVGGLEEYYEQSRISSKIHGLEVVTLSDKDREVFVTIVRNYGITDMVVSEVVQILYIPRKEEFVFGKILPVIEKCRIYKKETRNRIHLVISTQHGYDTTSNEIEPPEIDFDLNYNEDFKPVNDLIIDKLNTSKGIVLLHGAPGGGKSSYLKYLTGHLNKKVIFVPPNMASSISDPSFITFLSDNKNSVLVIEDAENVIKKRDGGGNQAISNLLNLSDGFLADVLNIGVVATFNCPVSDIDTALMRKGRMIAMYEFKELSVDRASKLSKKLGFGDVDKPMTLADIYNQEQEAFTQEKQTVGFKF